MMDPLQWVQLVLRATPMRWERLAEMLPGALLRLEPAPGEWSAIGCLMHLIDTEKYIFPVRVKNFLNGEDLTAFDPVTQGTAVSGEEDVRQLAEEFRKLRAESLILLSGVTEAHLDLTANHEELGPVTLSEMLHVWAAHDLNHTIQAERAIMQPFIAGSGPWTIYFKDHQFNQ